MIDFVMDYLGERGVYAFSDKEQAAMELGIIRFLQENGIRLHETREYYRTYTLKLLHKVDNADLKKYFINYQLLSEVNQVVIEVRDEKGTKPEQKFRLYSLMGELHRCGLGEKYVPIIEVKQILGVHA